MKNIIKIIITIWLFIFFQPYANAQKYDYVWKYVYDVATIANPNPMQPIVTIDFNQQPPLVSVDSARVPPTIKAELVSISDSAGNYIFYANGNTVINNNNQIMQNGDSLNFGIFSTLATHSKNGYPCIDGSIVIPNTERNNIYDIFHLKYDTFPENYTDVYQILRTQVDMSLDNGLGSVVLKNSVILEDTLTTGQLQAVKHANGIDWWILVSEQNTNGYYRFLLKADTLEGPFYQEIGRDIYSWRGFGQACFSPDGTKYARIEDDLDIYDFDRCTGELCNHRFVEIDGLVDQLNGVPGGACAFSPSNRFIYVTQIYELFQIDLWANDLDSAKLLIDFIDISDPRPGYRLMRLAPDNKIYIGSSNDTAWSVVNAPDNYGTACNATYKSFYLGGIFDPFTLPNFPHYRTPAQDSCPPCGTFSGVEVKEEISTVGEDFLLYPNPSHNGRFNIAAQQSPDYVQVHDLLGRLLLQETWDAYETEKELQLPSGAKGIYFVSVWKEGKLLGREKIVILE